MFAAVFSGGKKGNVNKNSPLRCEQIRLNVKKQARYDGIW